MDTPDIKKFIEGFLDPTRWIKDGAILTRCLVIAAIVFCVYIFFFPHKAQTIKPDQSKNHGTINNYYNQEKLNEVFVAPLGFRYNDKNGYGAMIGYKRKF